MSFTATTTTTTTSEENSTVPSGTFHAALNGYKEPATATGNSKVTYKKRERRPYPPGPRRDWWEVWLETESHNNGNGVYDPNTSRIDRMHTAANEFKLSRPFWPQDVRILWDQLRLFIGLLSDTPIWRTREDAARIEAGEFDPDDYTSYGNEDNSSTNMSIGGPQQPNRPRDRPRPPYATYGLAGGPIVDGQEDIQSLIQTEHIRKTDRANRFLNDPSTTLRVFLSSYMRSQGFVWTDKNLIAFPHLCLFFLRFCLRVKVLPEESESEWSYEEELNKAVKVCEEAVRQLPLTAPLTRALPGEFGVACKECWGFGGERIEPVVVTPSTTITDETVQAPSENEWGPLTSLLKIFGGPVSLPITRTTGLVEKSVRRVISVSYTKHLNDFAYDKFACIILEQWVSEPWKDVIVGGNADALHADHNTDPDVPDPSYLPGSRGHPSTATKHEITVVVDRGVLSSFGENIVGMGIGGTWVQMVGCGDEKSQKWWYMADVSVVLPSFHMG